MAFRIQGGFQILPYHGVGPDFFDFYNRLQDLRPVLQRMGRTAVLKYLAKTAVLKFDYWTYFEAERPRTPRAPLLDAIQLYESRVHEIMIRPGDVVYPDIDYSCEVSLFPLPDSRMIGLLSAANPDVRRVVQDQPWYEPYDYDAGRPPFEGVSQHEWDSRGRDWQAVFPRPEANPDLSGIRIMLAPLKPYWPESSATWPHPSAERILAEAPDYEYRLRLITETSLWHSWAEKQKREFQPSDAVLHALEFRNWINTESGRMSLQLQVEIVRKKLPKDVGISELLNTFVAETSSNIVVNSSRRPMA